MKSCSIQFLSEGCRGRILQGRGERLFAGVSTDSRSLTEGEVFFALSGPRFDGHGFLQQAVEAGAAAVVVEQGRSLPSMGDTAVVVVDDVRQALGRLAGVWRRCWSMPVIAVGGSNGKTTTKDLISSVLAQRFPTLSSIASFNNDVGVPLTLLRLDSCHGAAVVEVGTNHPGELKPLLEIVGPAYGVVTSLGREHLEHFGTMAGVAEEEGSIAEVLPADGFLAVNGDSPLMDQVTARTSAEVLRVGTQEGNDWTAFVESMGADGVGFRLQGAGSQLDGSYHVPLVGRHQVTNALLAMAIGARLGLGREDLVRGLADCPQPKGRMQSRRTDGVWVIDDSYNANPDSMLAALETLSALPCNGRRMALLGDMAEVGAEGEVFHEEVGRHAARCGLDHLWLIGEMAARTARAAEQAGLRSVECLRDVATAAERISGCARAGDILLVKASRSSRLERVTDALCNRMAAA